MVSPSEADRNRTTNLQRFFPLTLLFLIVVGSIGFRLIDIGRGLWLDELHTSWTVSNNYDDVGWRSRAGNQAPLYFYLVKAVADVFGHSEFSLRLVSLLASALLSVAAYLILKTMTQSSVVGLLAALLMALDPYFVEYAQEARPYALLQLLGLTQVYFFLQRFDETQFESGNGDSDTKSWSFNRWALIITTTICFYIHFTSILLSLSLVLSVLLWNVFRGIRWTKKSLSILVDFGISFLCCLPLTSSIWAISSRKTNWELFVNDSHWTPAIGFQFWSYVLPGLATLALLLWIGRKYLCSRALGTACVIFAAYLLPIFLAWISFKTGVAALYHQRYFMIGWTCSILYACYLVAIAIQANNIRVRVTGWIAAALIVVVSLASNTLIRHCIQSGGMPFESSWKRAVEHLNQEVNVDDLVILFPNLIEDRALAIDSEQGLDSKRLGDSADKFLEYCLFPIAGLYHVERVERVPRSTIVRPRFFPADKMRFRVGRQVFLLIRGDQAVASDILNEFAEYGVRNDIYLRSKAFKQFHIKGVSNQFISLFTFEVFDGTAESSNAPSD